ncbi:MAG: helix-turn-helix domain-containing protein, partial [Thermoplasmata archaeon]
GRTENDILEVKTVKKINFDDVFKPLVGFLNKIDGTGGVLVLGVKAPQGRPIEGIEGVDRDLVKNIEDMISDDILAYPTHRAAFHMKVERVPLDNGKIVVLIEVHPSSSSYAYYSDSENESALRKAYSTEIMKIADFVKFVEGKRSPRVKVQIAGGLNSKGMSMNIENATVILEMSYMNEGNKVGKSVLSVIDIYYEIRDGAKVPVFNVDGLFKEQEAELLRFMKDPKFALMKRYIVFLNPLSAPNMLYPQLPLKIGSIKTPATTFVDNRTLIVHIANYEETTSSEQEFMIQFQLSQEPIRMPTIIVEREEFSFY